MEQAPRATNTFNNVIHEARLAVEELRVPAPAGDDDDNSDSCSSQWDDDMNDEEEEHKQPSAPSKSAARKGGRLRSLFDRNHGQNDNSNKDDITAVETKSVRKMRTCLILFLLASIGLVGWSFYTYRSDKELANFEEQFKEDAKKVLTSLGSNVDQTLEAMDAFSTSLVATARVTNQTWPFVVIPHFGVLAEKIRALSNAVYINMYHLVGIDQREEWEYFTSLPEANYWVDETIALQEANPDNPWPIVWNYTNWHVIHGYDEYDKEEPGLEGTNRPGPWLPLWQIMPVIPYDPLYNWDLNTVVDTSSSDLALETQKPVLTEAYLINTEDTHPEVVQDNIDEAAWISDFLTTDEEPMEPISDFYYPVLDNGIDQLNLFHDDAEHYDPSKNKVVALLSISVYWRDTLKNILPESSKGILVVFENECNPWFTYQLDGANVKYLGGGDHHSEEYDDMAEGAWLDDLILSSESQQGYSGRPLNDDYCPLYVSVYPSDVNKALHTTKDPIIVSVGGMLIFILTSLGFIVYDRCVERRHRTIQRAAVKSKTVVESLFPEFVREAVEEEVMPGDQEAPTRKTTVASFMRDSQLASSGVSQHDVMTTKKRSKPLAELFTDTTVFFADIAGFTSWSSLREPTSVFELLETLYGAFDRIAKKRKVFKIETIGDCYVAVCGLPKRQEKHALIMCLFARDCREKTKMITHELEATLGPGTGDLTLRIGLHSGPTTAGVLRGEKARFQLFGDTVNTASRMESNGVPNLIHVSQSTADLLIGHGKSHWLTTRPELVNAKGKGMLQTYFVEPSAPRLSGSVESSEELTTLSVSAGDSSSSVGDSAEFTENEPSDTQEDVQEKATTVDKRLVDWNAQLLEGLLEEVVGYRLEKQKFQQEQVVAVDNNQKIMAIAAAEQRFRGGSSKPKRVRDEVAEVIAMPQFYPKALSGSQNGGSTNLLSEECKSQLRTYVERLAEMYRRENNPFHSFAHSSHVMMSAMNLLQRIAAKDVQRKGTALSSKKPHGHDFASAMAAEPFTKFSIAFSALIQDLGRASKDTLVEQGAGSADDSIHMAWELLMDDSFRELRAAIYTTPKELGLFRQLVINCVMATDLFDQELQNSRDCRWKEAFLVVEHSQNDNSLQAPNTFRGEDGADQDFFVRLHGGGDDEDASLSHHDASWDRKATIIMEHILQASVCAHAIQHWHVYTKWNECLFQESWLASKKHTDDPSKRFYREQLDFLDALVLPLATKLKECDVFGVSCNEFLEFATENRNKWEANGKAIVQEWSTKLDENT